MKKFWRKRDSNPVSSALKADALPLGQQGSQTDRITVIIYVVLIELHDSLKLSRQNYIDKSLLQWSNNYGDSMMLS